MNTPYSSRANGKVALFLTVFAFLLSTALAILAAEKLNVTGHWAGEMTSEFGDSVAIHFDLSQKEDALTETGGPEGSNQPIADAKLNGNHLTLTIGRAPEPVWKFDLTVAGKSITGKAEGSKDARSIGSTNVAVQLQ
jgi:hypothetical protein